MTAGSSVSGAALTAVGIFLARIASEKSMDVLTMRVHIHLLTGFYLAAGAAAALLGGAAIHLLRAGLAEAE